MCVGTRTNTDAQTYASTFTSVPTKKKRVGTVSRQEKRHMCVCVCVCVGGWVWVGVHTHIHLYIYTYMHACVCVCVYVCEYMCM
jgi:hypothetical protein